MGADLTRDGVIVTDMDRADDGVMLERLQRAAFGYFLQAVNPANGLVADTSRCTGGSVGSCVTGICVNDTTKATSAGCNTGTDCGAGESCVRCQSGAPLLVERGVLSHQG